MSADIIVHYADWTLYRNGGYCTDGDTHHYNDSFTVQDCKAHIEQRGLIYSSYYDDGNGNEICKGHSSCDYVKNISGWTIYQIYPNMGNYID